MDDTIIIPVSALQHWVYCPRQCALIHLEDAWTDSIFTLEGSSGHEHVDEMARGVRRGIAITSTSGFAEGPPGAQRPQRMRECQ